MSLWRLLRCNPFSKGGFDPIPKSVKEWRQSFSRSKSNE
jgi:putative component of membrane protein insertase Oxa1/YidC/SpoIIIJ protein YidD